ncbi:hypothetical protein AVEN_244666-1 [Araneus ventricosus]|uniref:Uncharacterized protein n=1 Tax=Araneus ventricosus TaxID=182803 RepID=A0A4Y2KJ52_ARAVE|nr:hypothetical protein AVEN_244666-1 [Araneus ventricosus]
MKIQDDPSGYDCIDTRACLQLVLLKMTPSESRCFIPDQTLQQPVAKVSTNKSYGSLRFRLPLTLLFEFYQKDLQDIIFSLDYKKCYIRQRVGGHTKIFGQCERPHCT